MPHLAYVLNLYRKYVNILNRFRCSFRFLRDNMDNAVLPTVLGIFCCWSNSTFCSSSSGPETRKRAREIWLSSTLSLFTRVYSILNSRISSRATDNWSCICTCRCQTRDNEDRLWSRAAPNLGYRNRVRKDHNAAVWNVNINILWYSLTSANQWQ